MEYRKNYGPQVRKIAKMGGGSKAKQSFKAECDINNIMKKFQKTGVLPEMIRKEPRYGDFSSPMDFQESMEIVAHAKEQFAALPARVRERFSNDPQKFLEFTYDGSNAEEMAKMGLMDPKAVERVQRAKESKSGGSTATPHQEDEGSTLKKGQKEK